MKLYCISHNYNYELEKLLTLFFPFEKIPVLYCADGDTGDRLVTSLEKDGETTTAEAVLYFNSSVSSCRRNTAGADDEELQLSLAAFSLLTEALGFTPQWGILTGIRPSKLMMLKRDELGEEAAAEYFRSVFRVSPKKTALALSVAKAEENIIAKCEENSFSLYVSIPFCPTRCSYCSFVSHSISSETARRLIPEYVERLCDEISLLGKKAHTYGLTLSTVYIGGGTPTTLSAEQLDTVLAAIENSFDMSSLMEYTVEAGRPDTVTREKLLVLKNRGVDRISINPQTFSDSVLEKIGRKHTVAETLQKFDLAREIGFKSINTDLIAGLPSDDLEGFKNSVMQAIALDPENITVHTLALKRSSTLVTENESDSLARDMTAEMIDFADEKLEEAGYFPYYMYRQSKSLGNLENVGWCKPGKECLYNVFMMEECQHIFSAGAGAVTKLVRDRQTNIERIFNYKYPYEFISRFSSLCEKKERIDGFFEHTINQR